MTGFAVGWRRVQYVNSKGGWYYACGLARLAILK
jgi:hypothetical protein